MNHVELVKSLYAAFLKGDIDKILAGADPNIEWASNADPALLPWGGDRKGLREIRAYFSQLAENVEIESFTPRDFYAGINFVVVLGHSTGRMKRSGGRFDDEWAHFFRITGGKVVSFREYLDTHAIVQAYIGGDIHAIGLPSGAEGAERHH
ncbi:nuclear transport factor 2 family protein [Rhodoblastus sp.]|jgi:hypothetical protein|uniref:nuclear transport factor 2 family protein n=1 Tax=Rhodoblastus sp. TaxID=1962975 RepID=UPI0025DA7186|nr:nuclear transport factor 2 family protein [Rhodoblastus sp.]